MPTTNLRNGNVLYRLVAFTDKDGVEHVELSTTHPPVGLGTTLYEFTGRLPADGKHMGLSVAESAAYSRRAENARQARRIHLADLRRVINARYHEDLTVEELAAAVGISSSTLLLTAKENGTSVSGELRNKRMEVAAELLRQGKTAKEVSRAVNVTDLPTMFKKHYGQTIKEFKAETGA